ncbi:MAG: arylsulfatase [Spirochaetales bacterium]|jgi:arylsulfatase A|nr:arylsulfatase [Spirochaetales bacterium]
MKPNIIVILTDDLGYGDLGCYNPKSKIPTPNLDRLAEEGVRFTDAHAPSSVCTPTRYAVLTGRYCWRTHLKKGVLRASAPPLIENDRITIGKMLQEHGYRTAAIGKWHLGQTWHVLGDEKQPEAESGEIDWDRPMIDGPLQRGFDYHFGIPWPAWGFVENDMVTSKPTEAFDLAHIGPEIIGPNNIKGMRPPGYEHEHMLPKFTEKAVDFIKEQNGKDNPFFLYWTPMAPHKPVVPNRDFLGRSQAGLYGDFVAELDDCVGRIMNALDDSGTADNTLLIFTSDNGPEITCYPRIKETGHYSMGDWRGVKRDTWEGGHREPFIARWPSQIPAGSTSDEIICLVDMMATAAEIVGQRLPESAAEDSVSILPAMLGKKISAPLREATVHHASDGHLAIRRGDWVYIDSTSGDANKEPDWFREQRGAELNTTFGVLYNLKEDPTECFNEIHKHPDIARSLKDMLEHYRKSGRSVFHDMPR